MNMNATAQMRTTTQVGCGKAKPKPTADAWTPKMFRQLLSHAANRGMLDEYVQDACNLINAALAAERERRDKWQRQAFDSQADNQQLRKQLAAERGNAEKAAARAELAQIQANDLLKLLSTASDIMQTTQPFAHAWAAEDLEDRVEDWLKEVARELERLRKTLPGSAP